MKIKKVIFTLLFILISSFLSFSQIKKDVPDYFPVSPNAASFAKNGLFPVDYSTGRININIPIYNIKSGELSVPIDISYNTSGIQLDELASWVGLGWNLNAGGAIVRNVKGIPDNGTVVPDMDNISFTEQSYESLYRQYNGDIDTAYDEFIINAPGLSGSFFFIDGEGFFKDFQNTIVKRDHAGSSLFEVIKDDGTIYRFGKNLNNIIATEIVHNTSNVYKPDYISTFYLTEIISSNGKDIISFNYAQVNNASDYSIIVGEKTNDEGVSVTSPPVLNSIFPNEYTNTTKQFLTSIDFANGQVEFTSAMDRQDLSEDRKLDKISIYSVNGTTRELIQEYGFVYDYYLRAGGNTTTLYPSSSSNTQNAYNSTKNTNARTKSLKLIELTNTLLNVKHIFDYETTALPKRGTTKKDYWGYINGNTGSLAPPTTLFVSRGNGETFSFPVGTGNRSANETLMQSGILQKITYPEGGYSIFEYEANRYFEYVTTPTVVNNSISAVAYGSGCNYSAGPSSVTVNFTPQSYVVGSGKLIINFTEASQESGGNTKVMYDGETFFRPSPVGSSYPGQTLNISKDFGNNNHTLYALENRTGNIGAAGCPSATITASWKEVTGQVTTLTEKLVGGLRIKSIKSYDGVSTVPVLYKKYLYENENPLIKEGNGMYTRSIYEGRSNDFILPILSTSSISDNNIGGSPTITYGKITESEIDFTTLKSNGKTEYYFENIASERILNINNFPTVFKSPLFDPSTYIDPNSNNGLGGFPPDFDLIAHSISNFGFYKNENWNYGSLLKTKIFKRDGASTSLTLVKSIENNYTILNQVTIPFNLVFNVYTEANLFTPGDYSQSFLIPYDQEQDYHSGLFFYAIGGVSSGKKVLTETKVTEFDANEDPTLVTITKNYYENPIHNQVTKTETTNSANDILTAQLSYPQDLLVTGQTTEMQKLIDQNRINSPVKSETYFNGEQTNATLIKYEQSSNTGDLLLPKEIHDLKGTSVIFPFSNDNKIVEYTLYDKDIVAGISKGNGLVLEYKKTDGISTVIIWGYNKTQPIAKIENASYAQVQPYEANLQTLSNGTDEGNLIAALDALRTALPNAMVTTYTYKPLVGMSTVTDPKGNKITYHYDSFNRLEFVKDKNGNNLSKNEYHYKN